MGGGRVFFVDVREEGQLVAAMPKLPDLFGDLLDPAGDDLAVDLVVLVLREVPVDDFFLRRELRFDRGQFGLVAGPCLVMRGPGGDDRVEGIVEPVGVEVLDGFEDPGVEGVCVDAWGVAVVDAVPVAGPAGVVAVGAAAAGRVGADVATGTRRAGDLAGEVVFRRGVRLLGGGLAAFDEDLLGEVEGGRVDHRVVGADGDDLAEVDLAEVDAIGEHVGDGLVAPRPHRGLRTGLTGGRAA